MPGGDDVQCRIPGEGGTFVGFDVNRYGSGPAGSYLTVLRAGVYDVGLGYRYTRSSGAPDVELAGFVEFFRGVGGTRLARIGTSGPPNRDLHAGGQAILRKGDLVVPTLYRSATTGSYAWTLTDSHDSLRFTARYVRPYDGPPA